MSKFNAAVNTIGIADVKVRQALMKLLENSVYNREQSNRDKDSLEEQIRRLSQKLSTIDFDIDEETAQKIADKISAAIGDSVKTATEAARTASSKADIASAKADEATADADELRKALQDIEGLIDEKAQQAASALIQKTQEAVNGATLAAQQASKSAQNAATTAGQASQAAMNAQNAVNALTFRNLTGTTVYNANADQYRKVATLPAVSSAANAVITFFGSIGGVSNATQKPIYVTIGQRQSGVAFEAITANGFAFGSSLPANADIVIYKESNNIFSVYLKGAKASYFRHNLSMTYAELVTPVADTYKTSAPTGTLVWSLLANYKVLANADDVTNAITTLKASSNTWSAAQTFSAMLTANGKILAKPTSGSWYQGRDLAAFKTNVATTGYVPIFSVKSSTGSWEIGTYTANNEFHIAHITDENYNAKNNVATVNICFGQDGRITGVVAPADDSNNSSVPTTAWVRTLLAAIDNWEKTQYFNNGIISRRHYSHIQTNSTDIVKGTVSASELYAGHIKFCDKNGNAISEEYNYVPKNSSQVTFLKRMWTFLSSGSTYKDVIVSAIDTNGDATISFKNCKNCLVPNPAGGIWSNNNEAVNTRTLNSFVAASRPYVEYYSHSILNQDLGTGNTKFPMSAMVANTSATYNVKVTFRNTSTTARTCKVNDTNVSLAGVVGQLASHQFTLGGSGTITIDNIATSIDVFITIWR